MTRWCAIVPLALSLAFAAGCQREAAPAAESPAASTTAATPARAEDIRELARDAYIWGFPIVDNYRVMDAYVLDPKNPEYKGPFNTVANNARLYTPRDKAIQTPTRTRRTRWCGWTCAPNPSC